MESNATDLEGLPVFDRTIFDEALELYGRLSVERYCSYAITLLNGPSVEERLRSAAGVRALSNSVLLYSTQAEGVISAMLYYLVALCEGLIMPHARPLIALACEEGNTGPIKNGKPVEAEKAEAKFGLALRFLATHAQPSFLPAAPTIARAFRDHDNDRLSKLRNSIAHFKFRFEIVGSRLDDLPQIKDNPTLRELGLTVLEFSTQLLGFPVSERGVYADPEESLLRYEEDLARPLTTASRTRTFRDVRRLIPQLEKFAFSLAIAYVRVGGRFQKAGLMKLGQCGNCKEGVVAAPRSVLVIDCPACGKPGNLR